MVEIWLPYGNTEVCLRVPTENLLGIIEPAEKSGAEDAQAAIEKALANPISSKPLGEIAKPDKKIAIALKDSGSSTNQLMISSILKVLNSAGIRDEEVTVIVAYDPLRASASRTEEIFSLGEYLSSRIRVMRHNPETSECVEVGKTSKGTKVSLNKAFVESSVKILAGVIEPHPLAGYSGGREAVLPGLSRTETIQHNFLLSLSSKARLSGLEDNPVHEDMVEAARLAGVNFSLNVVRNQMLEVVGAFAGDVVKSFSEGVKLAEEVFKASAEKRADIVFVSPGGAPLDADLFESCKVISGAVEAAKRGGAIVLMAECLKGYGNTDFYETMPKFADPDALEKELKKNFTVGGLMVYRLMRVLQRHKVYSVSMMPDHYVSEVFRMRPARTANEALRYAFEEVGKKGKVSVIPHGSLVVPEIKSGEEAEEPERK